MSLSESIEHRQSVRAFLPDAVDTDVVRAIFETARRAPSNGNLQPWEVHAVSGAALRNIRDRVTAKLEAGLVREGPSIDVYPRGLWEPFKSRRHAAGVERYAAMGFVDKDPRGLRALTEMNTRFFGAPVGLFFALQGQMQPHQWCDLGMFMQNVMLLATEQGLDTCPQAYWTNWSPTIAECLGFAEGVTVVAGMSLGRRDPAHPINRYRTERASVDTFAQFHGF